MEVSKISGALLRYWVARANGYDWACNTVVRPDDANLAAGKEPTFPVGRLFLLPPEKHRFIESAPEQADGWAESLWGDEIALNWDHFVPDYINDPAAYEMLIRCGKIQVWEEGGQYFAHHPRQTESKPYAGPDRATAAMRSLVGWVFNDNTPLFYPHGFKIVDRRDIEYCASV